MRITADELREKVHYNPETGVFTLLKSAKRWDLIGKPLGCVDPSHGYVKIRLGGRRYYAHHLAWLYVHGEWPAVEIDHRNGARSDNRFSNIREADSTQNKCNRVDAPNQTGFRGVSRNKLGFCARVKVRGKTHYLGNFRTAEEAGKVAEAARKQLHGEFAR